MPSPYPPEKIYRSYVFVKNTVDWNMVVLIFMGILTVLVFTTIFIFIPTYVKEVLDKPPVEISSPSIDCSVDIYNCENFTIQPEAQDVFNYCGFLGLGDIHRLDPNGNGIACEELPETVKKK